MPSLSELSVGEFLERLASAAPTPGGGSVAALAGALAAGLGQMAAALTLGRPRFADVAPQARELSARLARAGQMFRRLIDEDAAAYAELSTALQRDKADPGRAERVQQGAALAAQVPLETAALCRRVSEDLEKLLLVANPRLRSDIEAGMHLARAARHAAAANVKANLPLLEPRTAGELEQQLRQLLAGG